MLLNFGILEGLVVSTGKKCYNHSEKLDTLTKEPGVNGIAHHEWKIIQSSHILDCGVTLKIQYFW